MRVQGEGIGGGGGQGHHRVITIPFGAIRAVNNAYRGAYLVYLSTSGRNT